MDNRSKQRIFLSKQLQELAKCEKAVKKIRDGLEKSASDLDYRILKNSPSIAKHFNNWDSGELMKHFRKNPNENGWVVLDELRRRGVSLKAILRTFTVWAKKHE